MLVAIITINMFDFFIISGEHTEILFVVKFLATLYAELGIIIFLFWCLNTVHAKSAFLEPQYCVYS